MADHPTNTASREQLEAKIHDLSKVDQVKIAVIMGPAQLMKNAVDDLGGAVNLAKQLMSHNPIEGEKAFETMSHFVEKVAALADTDTLKTIAGELVKKAEKAVAERDAYGISMVAIAAIGEFIPGRALAKMNKLGDFETHGSGESAPDSLAKSYREKLKINNLGDYIKHRDEILSDDRYHWHPIASDKTLDDVPNLINQAKWELAEGYEHQRSLFNVQPPTPDYLTGKKIPENLADKEALLATGHNDIINTLKLIRASKSIPRGPESILFLHEVGAPPAVIASEITDHLFWARLMDDHTEKIMKALEVKAFYAADQNLSLNKRPFKKEPAQIHDAQDLSLADKFYTKFANDAYLAQLGNPGDILVRLKITPELLTESGAQSVLGVTNADGRVKFLLANEEMYGGKIPYAGDYKKITAEQAYQLMHQTENHVLNTKATEFLTRVANSAYLAKYGQAGDSITRIQLQSFKERGDSESLLLIKSIDGNQKLVHATNEFSNHFARYETISKVQADIVLNNHIENSKTHITNAKQTINNALLPKPAHLENYLYNNDPER